MRKGINAILGAVFVILATVLIATITSNWSLNLARDTTGKIKNTTHEELSCQYAFIYIKNATFNCSNSCGNGTAHNFSMYVANSGSVFVKLDKMYLQNSTGNIYSFDLGAQNNVSAGNTIELINISYDSCSGINRTIDKVFITSTNCPKTARDTMGGSDLRFVSCG